MRFDQGEKALSTGAVIARRDAHDTAKYLTEVALIDKAGASACLQHPRARVGCKAVPCATNARGFNLPWICSNLSLNAEKIA